jgi:dATP pyrophosphohydrolase
MTRAPFQVLILPYREAGGAFEFAVLARSDDGRWQGLAGGGEGSETPLEAARREALEEAGIPADAHFVELQTTCSVPAHLFRDGAHWGERLYVIPEYSFGVDCTGRRLTLSGEHVELCWLAFGEASRRLTYDSNRTALWELHQRLQGLGPRGEPAAS